MEINKDNIGTYQNILKDRKKIIRNGISFSVQIKLAKEGTVLERYMSKKKIEFFLDHLEVKVNEYLEANKE